MSWRFLAQRITGEGPGEWLDLDLPLVDPELTDVLSGPPQLTASLDRVYRHLIAADRRPLLQTWGTAIYAEADDQIRGGWLLMGSPVDGPRLTLDGSGFTTYPAGMPFDGDYTGLQVDPLDVVRTAWAHLQGQPGGDLGLTLDRTSSPVRIGDPGVAGTPDVVLTPVDATTISAEEVARLTAAGWSGRNDGWERLYPPGADADIGYKDAGDLTSAEVDKLKAEGWTARTTDSAERLYPPVEVGKVTVKGTPGTEAEPYTLNWWSTPDVGGEIDKLAAATPFDYHETHTWNADRTQVLHHLELGYPALGRRREDLRFVLGENIDVLPQVTPGGEAAANGVLVLGAGEGREMVRATAAVTDGRLRRVAVVSDRSLTDPTAAGARSRRELTDRRGFDAVTQLVVRDTPGTPVGSWQVGDEIRVQADGQWLDVDQWVRIVSSSIRPLTSTSATLTVTRTGG